MALFAALALAAGGFGLSVAFDSLRFIALGQLADGRIVDAQRSRPDKPSDLSMEPVIVFTPGDGRERRVAGLGRPPEAFAVGDPVSVYYLAEEGGVRWRENGFQALWLGASVFVGLGLVLGGIAGGIFLATTGRRFVWLVGLAFLLVGAAPVPVALAWMVQTAALLREGMRGEGVVTRVVAQESQRLATGPSAVNPSGFRTLREGRSFIEIRFTPPGGAPVTVTASWLAVGRWGEGARVPLVWPAGRPLQAQVDWWAFGWGRPALLLLVAAAFLAIGAAVMRSEGRRG